MGWSNYSDWALLIMNNKINSWYAVSGCSDLPPGSARAVQLNGQDIVLWRSEGGVAHAWQNRCLHRGMRLSLGQVRGELLSCRYHGWQFNQLAQCTRMPAQPAITPANTLCVPSYSCAERNGMIWVNLNHAEASDLDSQISDLTSHGPWLFCKSLFLDSASENLAQQLNRVNFPLFEFAGTAMESIYKGECFAPNLFVIHAQAAAQPNDKIALLLHSLSAEKSSLHILTLAAGNRDAEQIKQRLIIRWTRRLRWFIQNPCAQYDGVHPFQGNTQSSRMEAG